MNLKEAVEHANETKKRLDAEMEQGRLEDAERNRLTFDTSIVCGHRDNQHYIEIAEFDMTLCNGCLLMVMNRLIDEHSRLTDGELE